MNRKRLLDAARGLYKSSSANGEAAKWGNDEASSNSSRRPLRCFPLQKEHVQDAFEANTPDKFHSLLCQKIRQAKERVLLASLYVGPAATPQAAPKEQELLDALQEAAAKPNVQVDLLLDKNRALRKIPLASTANTSNDTATTSSAEAVHDALRMPLAELQSTPNQNQENAGQEQEKDKKNNLFLCSVLPASLQYFLPNPLNEVAGVFHIKGKFI